MTKINLTLTFELDRDVTPDERALLTDLLRDNAARALERAAMHGFPTEDFEDDMPGIDSWEISEQADSVREEEA